MSQVMPDTGAVATDGPALPEMYHQAASTMLAQRTDPSVMTIARDVLFAGTCF
jgi:hypothetical protein